MQFEVFTGGRHTGLMERCEQLVYEEVKAKMVFLDSKLAERIIGIIEKECCFAGEKIVKIKRIRRCRRTGIASEIALQGWGCCLSDYKRFYFRI